MVFLYFVCDFTSKFPLSLLHLISDKNSLKLNNYHFLSTRKWTYKCQALIFGDFVSCHQPIAKVKSSMLLKYSHLIPLNQMQLFQSKLSKALSRVKRPKSFYHNSIEQQLKIKKKVTYKADLIPTIIWEWGQNLLSWHFHVTDICGCFFYEDWQESIHSFLYVDLLTCIK